jgi:anti-sigma-K factor RskA
MEKPRIGDQLPFNPQKELDQVLGRYKDRRGSLWQRFGGSAGRALAVAALAIAAMVVVIYTLHFHAKQAQTAPAPKKPVQVNILPAK